MRNRMNRNDDDFRKFLISTLISVDIDSDVYTDFILNILKDLDSKNEPELLLILSEVLEPYSDTISDLASFTKEIVNNYNGILSSEKSCIGTETSIEEQQSVNCSVFNSDNTNGNSAVNIGQNAPGSMVIINCTQTEETRAGFDDNTEELELLYDSYLTWIQLIDQVDIKLRNKHSASTSENFSPDAISCALYSTMGDVDKSVEVLQQTKQLADTCRPCRHALTSKCMRRDCAFDHNLADIPCRFWLFGVCLKHQASCLQNNSIDSSCPFQHAVINSLPNSTNDSETSSSIKFTENDLDFPALLSSTKTSTKAKNQTKLVKNATNSSRNYKAAVSTPQYQSYSCPNLSATSEAARKPKRNQYARNRSFVSSSSISLLPADWVESGQSVAVSYASLRADAVEYAKARNKFLQEATRAYLLGDGATARNLSAEGQRLNVLMKECHQKAAQQIFRMRNTPSSLMRGQVDLHGLHVAEAKECLLVIVPILEQMNVGQVSIITGSGHHTAGPQKGIARLMPAVQATLTDDLGYKVASIRDNNGFVGGFHIKFDTY